MRVVFVAAECEPWAKTGGLGDVVDALARALPRTSGEAAGGNVDYPVDVFLPRYRGMSLPADAVARPLTVADPGTPGGVTQLQLVEFEARGYRVRLVDLPQAFDRDGYYGDRKGDFPDNAWRFGMLCRAALTALRADDKPVDVLNLHDWQSMPSVLYRDVTYATDPVLAHAAVVVTIHNLAYQGWVSLAQLKGMAFPAEIDLLVRPTDDGLLLLREGVKRAEMVNTVSPGYSREVLTPAFGMDMQGVLASRGDHFTGIINGLDMQVWDPATDAALPVNYSAADRTGKKTCRSALLDELGFEQSDAPVLGMIGRLDPQKGFDLLTAAAPQLVADGARIVALGTGDPKLVADLRAIAEKYPRSVAVVEAFDRALARRIYAGADLYVMPSRFEPCGQGQMISSRYGTVPVVTCTGGLADTVVDEDDHEGSGTGFVSDMTTVAGVLDACRRAMRHYRLGGAAWEALLDRAMAIDWSWETGPAQQYRDLYARAIEARATTLGNLPASAAGQLPAAAKHEP